MDYIASEVIHAALRLLKAEKERCQLTDFTLLRTRTSLRRGGSGRQASAVRKVWGAGLGPHGPQSCRLAGCTLRICARRMTQNDAEIVMPLAR